VILPKPIEEWFDIALSQEGVILISITPTIAIDAANLPGNFHKDPADRLIVATARAYDCPLITADREINAYPHVKLL
jgi:PIN domain nuclease of toxin-antitoxin system